MNPLKWVMDAVRAGRIDPYIALLAIVGTPVLVAWILYHVFLVTFR